MMIDSSSEDSDENDGEERCFRRDIVNAVERNNFEQLTILLKNTKYSTSDIINKRDSSNKNNTLLHIALNKRKRNIDLKSNTKIIKLLLEKGANNNIPNDRGETPCHIVNKRFKTTCKNTESIESLFLPNSSLEINGKKASFASKDVINITKNIHYEQEEKYNEESSFRNPTYKASGLKTSQHGVIYQLQLLILFLHRATKVYPLFYLATELDEAEKFDDVVLKYKISENEKEWSWRFLQAKHVLKVDSNKIKQSQLFSLNEKLPFSLHKYFNSFCKIKQNSFFRDANLKDFIICTNAELDPLTANEYFIKKTCRDSDKILFFKSNFFQMYKLKHISKNKLTKNYTAKFKENPKEDYLKEFLEKFRLITKFPSQIINRLIVKELGKKYGLLNAELATNTFKHYILEWFTSYKNGKSEYLLISDGKEFLKSIQKHIRTLMTAGLSLAYPEELKTYNISFQTNSKDIQSFLFNKDIQILHLVSEAPLLTSIKVSHTLGLLPQYQKQDSFIFVKVKQLVNINIKDLISDSFSAHKSHNLLIIDFEMHHKKHKHSLTDLYLRLLKILQKFTIKKIITIGHPENDQVKKINELISNIKFVISKDNTEYKHLDEISQNNILKKEISFQGEKIPLNLLINSYSAHNIFDEMLLSSFLRQEDIVVSSNKLCSLALNLNSSYIPRTFSRRKITTDILNNKYFLSSNLIFLTGAVINELNINISKENIFFYKNDQFYESGIILPTNYTTNEINIDIFKKLSTTHCSKNIYWLDYNKGQLRWESFIGNDIIIEDYINKHQNEESINEERFLKLKEITKKYYILEGEAGLGKSSFLTTLVHNLKRTHPLLWIYRINLNECTSIRGNGCSKTLKDITFSEDNTQAAINFMLDILIPTYPSEKETSFARKLLYFALQNLSDKHQYPKVVMLFDGFDEISPTYKESTLVLLKALQNSSILQVWITTRTHETFSLQQRLKSPAYTLNPFNHEQKIKYISNIYQNSDRFQLSSDKHFDSLCKCLEAIELNSCEQETTKNKVEQNEDQCLDLVNQRLNKALNANFTDNPLHLKMLTEITLRNKTHLYNNIDLLILYDEFVKIKFSIYYDEKTLFNGRVAADEMRQRDLNTLRQIHQELALSEFLPEFQNTKINTDEIVRIGFLKKNQSIVSFVHLSFAEYFVASYVNENFKNSFVQNNLYIHILAKSDFLGVRKFLNENKIFLSQLETTNVGNKNWNEWLLTVMIEEGI